MPKYERKAKRPTTLAQFQQYLQEHHQAAQPDSIPSTVPYREIVACGYQGGMSHLRDFMRALRPAPAAERVVHFTTEMGEHLQVDWLEFRQGGSPLHAFCATLGFRQASYVNSSATRRWKH